MGHMERQRFFTTPTYSSHPDKSQILTLVGTWGTTNIAEEVEDQLEFPFGPSQETLRFLDRTELDL